MDALCVSLPYYKIFIVNVCLPVAIGTRQFFLVADTPCLFQSRLHCTRAGDLIQLWSLFCALRCASLNAISHVLKFPPLFAMSES